MPENTNIPDELKQLTDADLADVSGGVVSYSIMDLAKLLPEPTRSSVLKINDHTEDGERKFLAALESELKINGQDHASELVRYYKCHHWEPIDSEYHEPNSY